MVVRTMAGPLGRVRRGGGGRRNPADDCSGDWGGAAWRPLVSSSDPVKFQEGGGACLIEKSLLHFLLRLLRCIYSRKSQLPSLLGYFSSAFLHAGIQLQPSTNGAARLLLVARLSGWMAQQ